MFLSLCISYDFWKCFVTLCGICVFRVPVDITDTECTVKGLTAGKPYEFRVAAVNEAGPGQYAETTEAIKPAAPPCE